MDQWKADDSKIVPEIMLAFCILIISLKRNCLGITVVDLISKLQPKRNIIIL